MVNFMRHCCQAYCLFTPAPVYSRNDYDQVHDSDVVNANGFFRTGNPLPTDRRRRYCRRRRTARPRLPEPQPTILATRAGPAGATRAAARICRNMVTFWKPAACRSARILLICSTMPDGDTLATAMQSFELVCRARFPRLCAAPGVAGAAPQRRHLSECLGGAAYLADHRGAGLFALLRRRFHFACRC